MKHYWIWRYCLLVLLNSLFLLIAGCSTSPKAPGSNSPNSNASSPPNSGSGASLFERPSSGAAALRQGITAFDMGEYGLAEKKLSESFKLGLTNTPDLIKGHKTQAFVYCVTARMAMCEKSFDAAFNVDRKFKLASTERPHPVWGPVFAKVQKRYAS
jgi:hypothetical protein